jgi:hypothetical protein
LPRFAGEGVGVTLNTNGWFVDVSLEGARAGLHDGGLLRAAGTEEGAGHGGGAALPVGSAALEWQRFVRLAGGGSYLRLNESGGVVMDALDGGTLADAESALRARYGIDAERARQDALAAARNLLGRRIVMAADASEPFPAESGTTDLPGVEPSR